MKNEQLRLCSQSPSRALLLSNAGVSFLQSPVDYDEEQIIATSPKNFVYKENQLSSGIYERARPTKTRKKLMKKTTS